MGDVPGSGSNNLTVDDRNTGIEYSSPDWVHEKNIATAFDRTLTGTNNAGANATFTFNGTGITVYGAYGPIPNNFTGDFTTTPPSSDYAIDGGIPVPFTVGEFPSTAVFSQQFFTSQVLNNDGEHTLVITNVQDGGWLWIDWMVYTPYDVTPVASPTTTPTPSPASFSSGSPSQLSAGGIAGAVIGSLAAVVLIVVAVYRYQSRRKRDLRTGAWLSSAKWAFSQRTLARFLQSDAATIYPSDSISSRNVPVDPPRSRPRDLPLPPTPVLLEERQLYHSDPQNRPTMPYPGPHTPSSNTILARGVNDHDMHAKKPGEYLY